MQKALLILQLLFFFIINISAEEKPVFLPKMDRDQETISGYFDSPKEADKYIRTNTSANDFYKAGIYYYTYTYKYYDPDDFTMNQGKMKPLTQKAVDSLAKAVEKEPMNAIYLVEYGAVYTIWGLQQGFPKLIEETMKGGTYMNKAVEMEPDNPEVRMIRMIQCSYFPYQYSPQYKPIIQADEKIIIKWLDDLKKIYSNDKEAKEILDARWGMNTDSSTFDEVFYCLGRYYYVELKDRKKGDRYFSKINKKSFWLKQAEKNKNEMDTVSW